MADKTADPEAPRRQDARVPGAARARIGPDVVDIRTLYGKTGHVHLRPGVPVDRELQLDDHLHRRRRRACCSTAATRSSSSREHCDFLEVCYLLLNGELPNRKQKDEFVDIVTHHTMVHEQLARFYQGFRRDAHPMAVMVGVVGALSAFYHDSLDINDPHHREISAFRLIAKMPTIVAMAYKYSIGQPFMYPKNDLSYTRELHAHDVRRAGRGVQGRTTCWCARMDRIFILHADHEQNASTSTVRLCGLVGRQPVRLHRRRHRLPLGPGARRRERGLPEDARGDRRRRQGAASSSRR